MNFTKVIRILKDLFSKNCETGNQLATIVATSFANVPNRIPFIHVSLKDS